MPPHHTVAALFLHMFKNAQICQYCLKGRKFGYSYFHWDFLIIVKKILLFFCFLNCIQAGKVSCKQYNLFPKCPDLNRTEQRLWNSIEMLILHIISKWLHALQTQQTTVKSKQNDPNLPTKLPLSSRLCEKAIESLNLKVRCFWSKMIGCIFF